MSNTPQRLEVQVPDLAQLAGRQQQPQQPMIPIIMIKTEALKAASIARAGSPLEDIFEAADEMMEYLASDRGNPGQ